MPTYSYRCTKCGSEFDIHQNFSDPALTTCEECGGSLRKLFSPVGVTFSGSGFYRTDSRSDKSKTKQPADSSGNAGKTPASTSSSPATPAPSPSTGGSTS